MPCLEPSAGRMGLCPVDKADQYQQNGEGGGEKPLGCEL